MISATNSAFFHVSYGLELVQRLFVISSLHTSTLDKNNAGIYMMRLEDSLFCARTQTCLHVLLHVVIGSPSDLPMASKEASKDSLETRTMLILRLRYLLSRQHIIDVLASQGPVNYCSQLWGFDRDRGRDRRTLTCTRSVTPSTQTRFVHTE